MNDAINPNHYKGFSNGAEAIDITENLTFNAGNAAKYLSRAGRLDGNNKGAVIEDLKKARWYVERELQRLGEVETSGYSVNIDIQALVIHPDKPLTASITFAFPADKSTELSKIVAYTRGDEGRAAILTLSDK